jgi:hypothetical protein
MATLIKESGSRLTTGWTREESEFESRKGKNFLFCKSSRPDDTHPASYPMGTRVVPPRVKQPQREADHSPSTSTEVNETESLHPFPQYVFMIYCLII